MKSVIDSASTELSAVSSSAPKPLPSQQWLEEKAKGKQDPDLAREREIIVRVTKEWHEKQGKCDEDKV